MNIFRCVDAVAFVFVYLKRLKRVLRCANVDVVVVVVVLFFGDGQCRCGSAVVSYF